MTTAAHGRAALGTMYTGYSPARIDSAVTTLLGKERHELSQ